MHKILERILEVFLGLIFAFFAIVSVGALVRFTITEIFK